jgi:two-component system, NtrC family, sensor histidine kinase HydH
MRRADSKWAAWAATAIAAPAAVALALTVLVARAGLQEASDLLVRGEAQALLATLLADADAVHHPLTRRTLERELVRQADSGLRYAAVVIHDTVVAQVGEARITPGSMEPGDFVREGRRARLVALLPPLRSPPPAEIPANPADLPLLPSTVGSEAHSQGGPTGPRRPGSRVALIILEVEPPIAEQLQVAMERTVAVGSVAVLILLSVALFSSSMIAQRARAERQAERDRRLVALGRMSSVMAHELRNPLASLKGHAQLLAEMLPASTPEHTKAERVVDEAERLEQLTKNLLDFVRDGPLEVAEVAPSSLLKRALHTLPGERIRIEDADAPELLWVDEARIALALGNLVRNALQAVEAQEPVEVRIQTRGRDVVFEVRDHGPGLPPGEEERLFEPFVTTRVRGTGLGLAVARHAVEQHGGTLRGETHPAGGAVFRMVLPNAARHR